MKLFNWRKKKTTLTDIEKEELEKDEMLLSVARAINTENQSHESPLFSLPGVKIISTLTYACHIGKTSY
jgi:hypothetical protein